MPMPLFSLGPLHSLPLCPTCRLDRFTKDPLAEKEFKIQHPVARRVASFLIRDYAHHLESDPRNVRVYDALKRVHLERSGALKDVPSTSKAARKEVSEEDVEDVEDREVDRPFNIESEEDSQTSHGSESSLQPSSDSGSVASTESSLSPDSPSSRKSGSSSTASWIDE